MICKGKCGEKLIFDRKSSERYIECSEAYIRYSYGTRENTKAAITRMCEECPKGLVIGADINSLITAVTEQPMKN